MKEKDYREVCDVIEHELLDAAAKMELWLTALDEVKPESQEGMMNCARKIKYFNNLRMNYQKMYTFLQKNEASLIRVSKASNESKRKKAFLGL